MIVIQPSPRFSYVECSVPEEQKLDQWRHRKLAPSPVGGLGAVIASGIRSREQHSMARVRLGAREAGPSRLRDRARRSLS